MSDQEFWNTLIAQIVIALLQAIDAWIQKRNKTKELSDDSKTGGPFFGGGSSSGAGSVGGSARTEAETPPDAGRSEYRSGTHQPAGAAPHGGRFSLGAWACVLPLVVVMGCGTKDVPVEFAGSTKPPPALNVLFGARASCTAHTYAWGKPALAGQVSCLVTAIPPSIKCTGAVPILGE